MKLNRSGQSLVEFSLFSLVIGMVLSSLVAFTHWFLVRQKLLLAARQGALLYSSGRLHQSEVEREMRRFLSAGAPPVDPDRVRIAIGKASLATAFYYQLDEVRVRYEPTSRWQRILHFQSTVEESCVVRHAPSYGIPGQTLYGPPVGWGSQ